MSMKSKVVEQFHRHPGVVLWVRDLAAETDATELQVQQICNRLINTEVLPGLEVFERGSAWVYRPLGAQAQSGRRLFEEIAITRSGAIIQQDQDGNVYRALPVE